MRRSTSSSWPEGAAPSRTCCPSPTRGSCAPRGTPTSSCARPPTTRAAYHEGRDDALRGIHLTGRRAAEAARDAGARQLLLTHLPVWNSPTRAVEEAQEVFAGPIGVADPAYTYRIVRRGSGRPAAAVGP